MTLEKLNGYIENRLKHHKQVLETCPIEYAKVWIKETITELEILSDITAVTKSRTSQPIQFADYPKLEKEYGNE